MSNTSSILETFQALKQQLCGISSNCLGNSLGLELPEVISLQKEASDILSLAKGLRNLTSPVGRLPGDVLERILAVRASEQDLLTSTYVCRRWREILLSSPRLWARFRCTDVARTLRYLARSQLVPIYVDADFYSDIKAVLALKSATDRFGSLKLRLRPQDLLQVFRQITTPAPTLEHLEIHLWAGHTFPPCIPATFLGGFAPALRSLHLDGINAEFNFFKFPALTHLTLVTNSHIFDMSELFRVFTSARLLEEVSVKFCGPTMPIPGSQGVVSLPQMKRLSFSNTTGAFPERLLSLLFMPSVEEVKLDISLPGEDTRTMLDFLPVRYPNFPHLLKADNLKLGVPHAHCNIQLSGPAGVVSIHASRTGSRQQKDDFQSRWLESLEPTSITNIKGLTLCNYRPEKPSDQCPILRLFHSMDGLRSLFVERCNNAILIKALSTSPDGSVLFPHLESFTLQPTTNLKAVFPGLAEMARARGWERFPPRKVSPDQYTAFRRSDVVAPQCHVNSVQLSAEADPSPPSKPMCTASYKIFANPKTPCSQTIGYSPARGLPDANSDKHPLVNLVTHEDDTS